MKQTAIQELLEWVRATLPMDLETPQMIEQKIKSMLEKEKEQIMDAYHSGWSDGFEIKNHNAEYYFETFNTNEK